MNENEKNVRELLIETAGRLFAERGFDGVSTRMIVKEARVNLGGIHYHFGSKEKLYVEAFKYSVNQLMGSSLSAVITENPEWKETNKGKALIIKETAFKVFRNFYETNETEYGWKLLAKELTSPSAALPILIEETYKPNHEAAVEFYKLIKPEASEYEINFWTDMLNGYVLFYLLLEKPITILKGKDYLNVNFFETAARMLAKAVILLADLPLPDDL